MLPKGMDKSLVACPCPSCDGEKVTAYKRRQHTRLFIRKSRRLETPGHDDVIEASVGNTSSESQQVFTVSSPEHMYSTQTMEDESRDSTPRPEDMDSGPSGRIEGNCSEEQPSEPEGRVAGYENLESELVRCEPAGAVEFMNT